MDFLFLVTLPNDSSMIINSTPNTTIEFNFINYNKVSQLNFCTYFSNNNKISWKYEPLAIEASK